MLDAARQYLEKLFPWDGGHYVSIHYLHPQYGLPGVAFKTIEGAMRHLESRVRNKKDVDVYASMGLQVEAAEKDGRFGKYLAAVRKQHNIGYLRSFYIDLDVKPGAYASTAEALEALKAFIAATGLPKPTMLVLSGTGGAHVYWTLTDYITPTEWQPWADALSAAAMALGLHHDSAVTVDCTRVLRIPDTFNGKGGGRLPVTLQFCKPDDVELDAIKAALEPYHKAPRGGQISDVNAELSAGIGANKEYTPRDVNEVAKICPFVLDALQTGGAAHNEPLWHAILSLSQGFTDPEGAARAMSGEHPGFDEDQFMLKLDAVTQDAAANPQHKFVSCKKISALGAPQCAGCPLLTKESNPLSLTPITPVAQPLAASTSAGSIVLPNGYFYGPKDGFIYAVGKDNGPAVPVVQAKIRNASLASNPFTLHFTVDHVIGELQRSVRVGDVTQASSVSRAMAEQDVMVGVDHRKAADFMSAFITQLQQSKATYSNGQAYGWTEENGRVSGFSYNGQLFTPDGVTAGTPGPSNFREIYRQKGDGAYWLEAVRLLNSQKRPALDAIVAIGFAAPLLKATIYPGVVVGGWGDTGSGKSTALNLATSIWAHPISGRSGLNDTHNALFGKLKIVKNLPMPWDEIQTEPQRAVFAGLLFQLTSGAEKWTMNRNRDLNMPGIWETALPYCSNTSMLGLIEAQAKEHSAGLMRIFEFFVQKIEQPSDIRARMDYLQTQLKSNYGYAGVVYSEWLGANYDRVAIDMDRETTAFEKAMNSPNEERFWRVILVAIMLGAQYANDLGLANFDLPALSAFMREQFERMRGVRRLTPNDLANPENVAEFLRVFLNERASRNTIYTDIVFRAPRRPNNGDVKLIVDGPAIDRLDTVQAQLGCHDRVIRVSEQGLKDWLKKREIEPASYIAAMRKMLGAVRSNARLGSGIAFEKIRTNSENVWTIDTRGTPLEDKIGWGVSGAT